MKDKCLFFFLSSGGLYALLRYHHFINLFFQTLLSKSIPNYMLLEIPANFENGNFFCSHTVSPLPLYDLSEMNIFHPYLTESM